MKISKIELENWMIFGGQQKVEFATDSENITLIFGENMHGKTSLLNSIRWCLYGSAINRQGKGIPTKDLINIPADRRNEPKVSVKLNFEVDGSKYELLRELDYSSSTPTMSKSLKIDGRVVDGGKIESEIDIVLPEQISQFMLFDGELLTNFENLVVAVGSAQATGIKNAIETNLGIPRLRKAFEVAETVAKDLKKVRKKELDSNAQSRLVSDKLTELELIKETKIKEKKEITDSLSEYRSELSDLAEQLHDTEEALRLIEQRKNNEENLHGLQERQKEIQNELKRISATLWLVPLREAVAQRLNEYNDQLTLVKEKAEAQSSKTLQVVKLQRSLEKENCPTCGTSLSESKILKMREELRQLQDELILVGDTDDLTFELKSKIRELDISPTTPDETERYKVYLEQQRNSDREMLNLENKIYEIQQKLKGVDEQTSLTTRNKYDAVNKEIAILENDIQKIDTNIVGLDDQVRSIRKSKDFEKLSKDSDIVSKTEKAEQVQEILGRAITLYRDEMRSGVEHRATETFRNLTTEQTFDKLEINESYGLSLIVDGTKVNRSAGAEQIVAISLIEALNFHGRRKGPMIMDTPVGRLDNKHRTNILSYLPKVVTQLAIFAHSGELEEDANFIDPHLVGARFRIEREDTFQSNLVRI